ncbi:hypothetical protein NDU88_007005 [Pleurodeles waltl]|uniref:Uncharacterized protein n=1 Tax=Pleurodeles waltl TaxID=8319 RepID=A0AAV7SR62_PLEWA|nr:hypothetical protein NDU88_007005 [Pleurodeles waltl]
MGRKHEQLKAAGAWQSPPRGQSLQDRPSTSADFEGSQAVNLETVVGPSAAQQAVPPPAVTTTPDPRTEFEQHALNDNVEVKSRLAALEQKVTTLKDMVKNL